MSIRRVNVRPSQNKGKANERSRNLQKIQNERTFGMSKKDLIGSYSRPKIGILVAQYDATFVTNPEVAGIFVKKMAAAKFYKEIPARLLILLKNPEVHQKARIWTDQIVMEMTAKGDFEQAIELMSIINNSLPKAKRFKRSDFALSHISIQMLRKYKKPEEIAQLYNKYNLDTPDLKTLSRFLNS